MILQDDIRIPAHGTHRRAQIVRELDLIEKLDLAGYFLIVWDIVEFCRRADIYCQGRGPAANSAVCYAIGITKADAVSLGLLFERFPCPERDRPPDLDLGVGAGRRAAFTGDRLRRLVIVRGPAAPPRPPTPRPNGT